MAAKCHVENYGYRPPLIRCVNNKQNENCYLPTPEKVHDFCLFFLCSRQPVGGGGSNSLTPPPGSASEMTFAGTCEARVKEMHLTCQNFGLKIAVFQKLFFHFRSFRKIRIHVAFWYFVKLPSLRHSDFHDIPPPHSGTYFFFLLLLFVFNSIWWPSAVLLIGRKKKKKKRKKKKH